MVGATACRAPRRDGSSCRAVAVLASGYCAMHDPDRQTAMQAARAQGGRNKSRGTRLQRLVPRDLRPALALLFAALDEVHGGALDPRQGTAMAALAGAIAR